MLPVGTDWLAGFAEFAVPGTEWEGGGGVPRNYQNHNFGSFLDREIVIFSHKNVDFDHFCNSGFLSDVLKVDRDFKSQK